MALVVVVAGVLRDHSGRVLLAQRPAGKELAGCWEFPGGKLEAGESAADALARELREELDLVVEAVDPHALATVPVDQGTRQLRIEALQVRRWSGFMHPREGQDAGWFWPADVNVGDLAPADQTILAAVLASPGRHEP